MIHNCFWTALVLAVVNTCAACQTAAPSEARLNDLERRVMTLETQMALLEATPKNDGLTGVPEDRD